MNILRTLLILSASLLAVSTTTMHPLSDEFIENINSKQTIWKAGRNFPSNIPLVELKELADVHPDINIDSLPRMNHDATFVKKLPVSFDPRNKWPTCLSLHEIRDQGSCKSSWASAAVGVMTDRVCIHSNGSRQFHFSAEDLISCCTNCGFCKMGDPLRAWKYWMKHGIVSGGNYNSSQGCRSYSFPPCEHQAPSQINLDNTAKTQNLCSKYVKQPQCVRTCDKNHHSTYKQDKKYGDNVYSVKSETHIKAELMMNGPVEAVFMMSTDFFNYKSGVYQYTIGNLLGLHAVKLMGWGVENGTKYWLAANSWNSGWGDHGYFKFLRGVDHLGISSMIVAGTPLL